MFIRVHRWFFFCAIPPKFAAALACSLGVLLSAAHAHPIHTSLAEADYNRSTQKLEIALRVFADDFEAALAKRAGRPVALAKTPAAEFDALARAYLAENFTVRSAAGQPAAPRWVGKQLEDAANELWLFVEYPFPGDVDGALIRHGFLRELFPNQLNSVLVRAGPRAVTLVFFPDPREKSVRFPAAR